MKIPEGKIWTVSGKNIDINNINPKDICIEDMAHALSQICRFSGNVTNFYCVLSHSILVCEHLKLYSRRIQLLGLIHDCTEAFIGDIISPVKERFPKIRRWEADIMNKIYEGLEIQKPTEHENKVVKQADVSVYAAEVEQLLHHNARKGVTPTIKVRPSQPQAAKSKFLKMYYRLKQD